MSILVPPINVKPKIESSNGGKSLANISHLEWLTLNTELAVADSHGNFFLLLSGVSLLNPKNLLLSGNGTGISETPASKSTGNGSGAITGTGTGTNGHLNGDIKRPVGKSTINNSTSTTVTSNGKSSTDQSKPNINQPTYEYTTFSHMELIYRDLNPNTEDETNSEGFVAFKWLPTEKTHPTSKPATLIQSESDAGKVSYNYGAHQYTPKGVAHPIGTKQACVALRRNGEFVMYYQGEHKVEYHKLSVALEEPGTCAFEHAGIGFVDKNTIAVCAYDLYSDKINSYLIKVDWGFLVQSADRQKHDPLYSTPLANQTSPSLKKSKIESTMCISRIMITEDNDEITTTLTSIDLLNPSYDSNSRLEVLITYEVHNGTETNSTIYNYRLQDQCEIISNSFLDLGIRKGVSKPENSPKTVDYGLILQHKWKRRGKIQRIEPYFLDTFFLVIYTNGKIDIVERDGMKLVELDNGDVPPKSISILQQAGFQFPAINNPDNCDLILGVSPTGLSIVYVKVGKNNNNNYLELALIEKNKFLDSSDTNFTITAAAFATCHSFCCYTTTSGEDLILLIQSEVLRIRNNNTDTSIEPYKKSQDFADSVLKASHLAINFYVSNYHKESVDRLVQNPALQRLLSLQLLLGEMDDKNRLVKDIAWSILNLRSSRLGIAFLLSGIYKQMTKRKPSDDTLEDSTYRAEFIMSLMGNAKFLIDFFIYINQELVHLCIQRKSKTKSQLTMENSIALPMLICRVPRLILMYALNSVMKTCEQFKKIHQELMESNKLFSPMKEALNRYFTICTFPPIVFSLFEQFLRECDALVTKEFNVQDQLTAEQDLICKGKLSSEAHNVANAVLDRFSTYVNRDNRVSEQFFYDVDWLGIGICNDKFYVDSLKVSTTSLYVPTSMNSFPIYRLQQSPTQCFDALRKVGIDMSKSKIRKCSKCRGISLATDPVIYELSHPIGLWTVHFQRMCICGGVWVHSGDPI
ncbi:mediator complex subunit [Scheffersomyces spartinae]|uniref:Mediator of RNA polymerase II transcription subunit 16 n=1 Tax=Scheffersomyces spartinae TaxID=45513 RepID=A0A9P8AJ03_9ASCO|nr:mediator complex subunit [Scheffersomyces spartinae]KAG7194953.1 mediator complex subunit [Scheffersomyces spartinae]